MRIRSRDGQASVELVALLPLLVLGVAAVVQVMLVGHSAWAASQAAVAAARAEAVGSPRVAAARAALPRWLEREVRVRADGGRVQVAVAVPSVVPGLSLGRVRARSAVFGGSS